MMIHPTADVQTYHIGDNTSIWQYTIVLKNAQIGSNSNINAHCFIENDVYIGNMVTVKCGVYLWDGITVEDNVFIGPNVTFTNDKYPKSKKYPSKFQRTVLKERCSIGAATVIMGGVTIGKGAMVGANSLVTRDIPSFQLWYGSPAVHKGYVTDEGIKIGLDLLAPDGTLHVYKDGELFKINDLR